VNREAAILGFDMTLAYPEGFDLDPECMATAKQAADESGAKLGIVHDIKEAAPDAHVFYAKSWMSFSLSTAQLKVRDHDLQKWLADDALLDLGDKCVKFMHPHASGSQP
jgi:ornithine carbamoyltransferase